MLDVLSTSWRLLQGVSVMMILVFVLLRTRLFSTVLSGQPRPRDLVVVIGVFGLFSIFGTVSGQPLLGASINSRDLGPALAGLLAGPMAGLGAGLIGGIHRAFLGGPTGSGCAFATVLAGLIGGLVRRRLRGRLPSLRQAATLAFGIEAFHMLAGLAVGHPDEAAVTIVRTAAVPMLLANVVGMVLFVLIVRTEMAAHKTQRAKEAIERELHIARDIQMGIVPRIFPGFPNRSEVELFALLESAKEVGGDFFDYYPLDENRIFLLIGDVSGKGVPASLVMAVTMTLFKAYARPDRSPDEIMAKVNDKLAGGNDSGLFVTAFCAMLDLASGVVRYANAGHNPPLVLRVAGASAFLPRRGGVVLGAMPDYIYKTGQLTLFPGDSLVLYTDGVTELMDSKGRLFGEDRLFSACLPERRRAPKMVVDGLVMALSAFAGDAAQSDDITILAVRYVGPAAGTAALDAVAGSGI